MNVMPKKSKADTAAKPKEADPNHLSGGSKPKIVPKEEVRSMADKLGKKEKPKKSVFSNPLYIIGAIVAALILVGLLIMFIAMSGNDSTPQAQAIPDAPTAEEIARAEAEAQAANTTQAEFQPVGGVVATPANDFSLSATPIETLSQQSTANALQQTPQYLNGDGMNLRYPDGSLLPLNHPYIDKAIADTQTRLQDYIINNGLIQERTDETGISAWNIQMPDGTYAPITDPSASSLVRDSMSVQAVSYLTEELNLAPLAPAQPQSVQQPYQGQNMQQQQPAVVVNAISEQEKQEYRDLINTLRTVNQDLAKQNREVTQEAQEQKEQMVSVLQKIEDSKYASQKLRASSIPLSSGWSLHAIVNDRLWLQDPNGELVSIAEGEAIPTTGLRVLNTEPSSNMVLVTPVE